MPYVPRISACDRPDRSWRHLAGSEFIVVTVPDIPAVRIPLIQKLITDVPLSGKALIFVRAGQAGQPVIASLVRESRALQEASVVLVEDSFYGTRVSRSSIEFKRKLSVNVAVYASKVASVLDGVRALFRLGPQIGRDSWPELILRRGTELLFDPLGYIIHTGVALHPPNLKLTERGIRYSHHIEGVGRRLARRLNTLDLERVQLAGAFGVAAETFPEIIHRQYGIPLRDDLYDMLQACRRIYRSRSSGSIAELVRSRHLLEDVPALYTVEWLARCAGRRLRATQRYSGAVDRSLRRLRVTASGLRGYQPFLEAIEPDVQHISSLLDAPHELAGVSL
jgi:opine dehydrogenase